MSIRAWLGRILEPRLFGRPVRLHLQDTIAALYDSNIELNSEVEGLREEIKRLRKRVGHYLRQPAEIDTLRARAECLARVIQEQENNDAS